MHSQACVLRISGESRLWLAKSARVSKAMSRYGGIALSAVSGSSLMISKAASADFNLSSQQQQTAQAAAWRLERDQAARRARPLRIRCVVCGWSDLLGSPANGFNAITIADLVERLVY